MEKENPTHACVQMHDCQSQKGLRMNSALSFYCCVSSGQVIHLSEPQFLRPYNGCVQCLCCQALAKMKLDHELILLDVLFNRGFRKKLVEGDSWRKNRKARSKVRRGRSLLFPSLGPVPAPPPLGPGAQPAPPWPDKGGSGQNAWPP